MLKVTVTIVIVIASGLWVSRSGSQFTKRSAILEIL